MKLLLLEDNPSDADLTIIGLSRLIPDVSIKHVSSLEHARNVLAIDNSFDVALFDVNLPDGDGLDLLVEIRQQGCDFPVIILTGSGDEEAAVTALKSGAEDYIVKRFDYVLHLPDVISQAITNFKENSKNKSEVIDVLYIEHHIPDIESTIHHFAQYAPYIHIDAVSIAAVGLLKLETNYSEKYKVILMDYRLPGMDAIELIKTIRQTLKLKTPIILVTGQGNEELAVQALKLGANDYLTKNENYLIKLPGLIVNCYHNWELKRNQQALIDSEAKYRLIADNSGDTIFVLDMNLKYTYISPAVQNIRGFMPHEVMSQSLEEVISPSSYQKAIKAISELLVDESFLKKKEVNSKTVELELIRKDKTTVWTEVKASLILDDNKIPVGFLGVARDISERKLMSDKLIKISRAVEQSPTLIVITDTKGNIEYVNPKFTETTGYTLAEVIGKNPRILKSGYTSAAEYKELWKTISSGQEWKGEFHNKRKDGTLYWEETAISSIKDAEGAITHYVAVKLDITEKKKIVDELIISKEKAVESDRLKSAFLANISHEIRTPMNGILGFAQLLKEPNISGDNKDRYIKIIEKSGNRMLNIINDIVDISKIEAGLVELRLSETNINEQIEYAYAFFKPEANVKGIDLIAKTALSDVAAVVKADTEKLYSVILNLVKNAIKYSDEGTIKIGYTLINDDIPYIEFYVSDTGIGISKDKQATIFERFIQVDIKDRQYREGAGLGLSISKAFVELMGGAIRVQSNEYKGTTFYFTLPYLPTNATVEKKPMPFSSCEYGIPQKLKVLIAEDDLISEKLLSIILKPFNWDLIYARNGAEAVKLCEDNPELDLIFMDIQMPIMNGFEATKLIREFNKKVKIIAQTAFALSGDEEKIKEAGCDNYINKPVKKESLFMAIKEVLQ